MFPDTSEITIFEPLVLESEAEISDSGSPIASLVIEEETDSEGESGEAEAQEATHQDVLGEIQQIITRLYRITSIIRRPGAGPKNERERVLRYVQNQEPPIDLSELKLHIEWQLSRLRGNTRHRGLLPGSPLYNTVVDAALLPESPRKVARGGLMICLQLLSSSDPLSAEP
jgi:hypothetical protein